MTQETSFGLQHRVTGQLVRMDTTAEDHGEMGPQLSRTLSFCGHEPFEADSAAAAARAVTSPSFQQDSDITAETVRVVRLVRTLTIEPVEEAIPLAVRVTAVVGTQHRGQPAVRVVVESRPGLEPGALIASQGAVRRILEVGEAVGGKTYLICTPVT